MAKGRGGSCCMEARGRGGVPVAARGLGGDIGAAIGDRLFPGMGGSLGRIGGDYLGKYIGNRFGFKKGGRVPASLF
jgi:hypothetical protein